MATARLLRASVSPLNNPLHSSSTAVQTARFSIVARSDGERNRGLAERERKSTVAVKAVTSGVVIKTEPRVGGGIGVSSFGLDVVKFLSKGLRGVVKIGVETHQIQAFIERGILDCRFFTLFAVAGSLLGSILCFIEGCFLVLQTYLQYLNILSQGSNEHLVHLLMEAIDMFLVGTSMLIFGMGLYTLFVKSRSIKEKAPWVPDSNLFGLFPLKKLPPWIEMDSVLQAKSKIGHAVVMILHVGMLEKWKSIPVVTSLDLACFAGSVLISSACMFLLSKLSTTRITA